MGRKAGFILFGLLLLAPACGAEGGDGDFSWSGRFSASESTTTSTGGAVVAVQGKALRAAEPWILGEPAPWAGELPPMDLTSVGEALFLGGPDREVVDAIPGPDGTVALLADPASGALELRLLGEVAGTAVPGDAYRILLVGESPLRVLVVLPDDRAVAATHLP